mgnify:CR=1 FL=1|jgi:hypothetical protein
MSLVATASTWTNEESSNKKRVPSIRKTVKIRHHEPTTDLNNINEIPESIEQFQNSSEQRSSRVNNLLDKLTSSGEEDNNKMGEFKPISPPEINVQRDYNDDTEMKQYIPPVPKFSGGAASSNILGEMKNYGANDIHSQSLSNYNKSYEPPSKPVTTPYYAKMGIDSSSSSESQLMEKINYMIHLMEQQQHEKTENITEEFLLYTFLGVFVIFVVDSFARAGKYTR